MGQRANLVVVQGGGWCLYYDHWCANRLDVELFWGPADALRFIEQCGPAEPSAWLDEVWCEGAALVDLDHRVLLFFGGEDALWDIPLRRAHLSLMAETWPGWDIRWADEGIVSLGTYLGLPRETFLDADRNARDSFKVLNEYPEDNLTLLTVTAAGTTTAGRVYGEAEALEGGPGSLDDVIGLEGARALEWTGEMPTGGLHLDFDRRTLAFWWAHDTPAIEDRVADAWPGWDATWLRDRYEAHLELAGLDIRLPVRPPAELQAARLADLRRLCHHEAKNPVRELAARIGATDINPATDAARGSVGDQAGKLRLLDELSRRLPGAGA